PEAAPKQAPPKQAPGPKPAAGEGGRRGSRRRRRRSGARAEPSALEQMAAQGPRTLQTLPSEGLVLEEVIDAMRDEYGYPATRRRGGPAGGPARGPQAAPEGAPSPVELRATPGLPAGRRRQEAEGRPDRPRGTRQALPSRGVERARWRCYGWVSEGL